MKAPRPRPGAFDFAASAKAALRKKPKIMNTGAAQAASAHVQDAINKLQKSPLARSPIGQKFQGFLQDRLSRGEDLDEFIEEVKGVAEREIAKRRNMVSFLSEAANLFRGDRLMQVRTQVIQPARTNQLSGSEAWDRLSSILGTPYPLLTWVESHLGKVTIGAALTVGAGLAVGGSKAYGISGIRHGLACFFEQDSVCAGAVAGADFGGQLAVSPGIPQPGLSYGLEVSLGGGYGATGSLTVALKPTFHHPTFEEAWLLDYEFSGLAVSLGGGGGLNVSLALGVTRSVILEDGKFSKPVGWRDVKQLGSDFLGND